MANLQIAPNWSPVPVGSLTTTGQFSSGGQYNFQSGVQMQYQTVQMPVPMQQIMQLPVQPVQEIQLMQMPMQEVQMVPVQMPIQQINYVTMPTAPPLRPRPNTPSESGSVRSRSPSPKREDRIEKSQAENNDIYRIEEVPVMQCRIVEVPVEVETRKIKDNEIPVEKLIVKNVKTVQKKVEVERCIWKEVPITKTEEIQVPVEVIKTIEQEKIVYKDKVFIKEVLVEQEIEEPEPPPRERAAPPEKVQPVYINIPVTVEKVTEHIVEVPVEQRVEIPFERIIEVPVERVVQVPVEINKERIYDVPVEQVTEKIVEKIVEREVEKLVQRFVQVPVEVTREVEVEVPVERIVYVETEPVYETRKRVVQVPVMVMQEQVVEEKVEVGTRTRAISPAVQTYTTHEPRVTTYERSSPVAYERQLTSTYQVADYQAADYLHTQPRPSLEYAQIRRPSVEHLQIRRPSQEYMPSQALNITQSRVSYEPSSSRSVGVGLALERRDGDNATYVESIVPGFAADLSGQFQVGDILTGVDYTSVENYSLDAIKQLTIGAEGSKVTLHMMRNGVRNSVTVQRIIPASGN